jgi:uncharacterized protein YutE (UPF0331/DUF86 family)
MTENLLELLKEELKLLDDAAKILKRSFEMCRKFDAKKPYPIEELDHLEALTSRFARLSDILTQKVLRLIDEIDLETPGTMRDRLNRAEKKEIISNAESFAKIRHLRNDIAHEYMPQAINEIFLKVIEWTPVLLKTVEAIHQYTKVHYKL